MKIDSQKGVSIIAVVATMLILSVMGVVLVSLVTTGSDISVNQLRSEQALNIAHGGIEFGLHTTTRGGGSWGEFTFSNRSLGAGTFTLSTNTSISGTERRMTLDSAGSVSSSNLVAERSVRMVVRRVSGGGGTENITDGGFPSLVNWPDGNCPPNKNTEGTVSVVSNALSIATQTGKTKTMDDCVVQTLGTAIPPSTNVILSLQYKFDANIACGPTGNDARCNMSVIFIYSDGSTETPWATSAYPSIWTSSGNISWATKAGLSLVAVRLKYDIKSANDASAWATGWLDDVTLISSGTIPVSIVNWQEIYQ